MEEYFDGASTSRHHLTRNARSGLPSRRSASLDRMVDGATGHHLDDGLDLPSPPRPGGKEPLSRMMPESRFGKPGWDIGNL